MGHLVPPEGCELFVLARRAHEEGDTPVLPSVLCFDHYTLGGTKAVPASIFYEANHLSLTPHLDPTPNSQYIRAGQPNELPRADREDFSPLKIGGGTEIKCQSSE